MDKVKVHKFLNEYLQQSLKFTQIFSYFHIIIKAMTHHAKAKWVGLLSLSNILPEVGS